MVGRVPDSRCGESVVRSVKATQSLDGGTLVVRLVPGTIRLALSFQCTFFLADLIVTIFRVRKYHKSYWQASTPPKNKEMAIRT